MPENNCQTGLLHADDWPNISWKFCTYNNEFASICHFQKTIQPASLPSNMTECTNTAKYVVQWSGRIKSVYWYGSKVLELGSFL